MNEFQLKEKQYTKEDVMLADFMTWAKNTYPSLRKTIFHIENEGDSSGPDAARRGGVSLAKGKLAGVPDVCCVHRGRVSWAEFKTQKGTYTPKQKELLPVWVKNGIKITEIRSFEDWQCFILNALAGNDLIQTRLVPFSSL